MGSTYLVHEDKYIKIEVDEISKRYTMDVCMKSEDELPVLVIDLFNNAAIEASVLAEMGYNILYAAFLKMEYKDIRDMKLRVANL